MTSAARPRCYVVVGMHRSGTSTVARGLMAAGVAFGGRLGDPESGAAGNAANPKGYFENEVVVEINDSLLELLGGSWHEPIECPSDWLERPAVQILLQDAARRLSAEFGDSPCWGFKDPRCMRVLPFWQEVLRRLGCDVRYVLVCRNPLSTAASIARRDGFPFAKSLCLWLDHWRLAGQALLDAEVLVIDYDRLMTDAQRQWQRIERFVGLGEMPMATADYLDKFVDAKLRHGRFEPHDVDVHPITPPPLREAYARLRQLAADQQVWQYPDNQRFWTELPSAWQQFDALLAPLQRDLLGALLANPGQAPSVAVSRQSARDAMQADSLSSSKVAICVHLHYEDVWPDIEQLLLDLRGPYSLYMTLTQAAYDALSGRIQGRFPQACLLKVPNRGRDIGPFLWALRRIREDGCVYLCKIHGKKTVHRKAGEQWRQALLRPLLGRSDSILRHVRFFESRPDVGMVGPRGHFLPVSGFWGGNRDRTQALSERIGISWPDQDFRFFAGSMFWCRTALLQPLLDADIEGAEFEPEAGQVDGTLAHAIERLFPLLAVHAGLACVESNPETDPDGFLVGHDSQAGDLVYVEQLLGERADLGEAYRQASELAVERLRALQDMERKLDAVHQALEEVKALSLSRLNTLQEQSARLDEVHAALDEVKAQSVARLAEIVERDRRLDALHAALDEVKAQSVARLAEITERDLRLEEVHGALDAVTRLSLERLSELQAWEGRWEQACSEWETARHALEIERDASAARAAELLADIRRMQMSRSWRYTAPLRRIEVWWRRLRGRVG